MIRQIEFTPLALRGFQKLPHEIQKRIQQKLDYFLQSGSPLAFAKPLTDLPPATHRYRIGKYRVLFHVTGTVLVVTDIDKREDIYRR